MLALGSHCPNSNRRLFCLPKLFELYRQTPEGIMRLASSRWLADGNDTIIITNSFYLQLGVLPRIFSWICKRYRDGFMREFAFINNCFVGNFVKLFRSAAVNIVLILQRKTCGEDLSTVREKQLLDNYKVLRLKLFFPRFSLLLFLLVFFSLPEVIVIVHSRSSGYKLPIKYIGTCVANVKGTASLASFQEFIDNGKGKKQWPGAMLVNCVA